MSFLLQFAPYHAAASNSVLPYSWPYDWALDLLDSANWSVRTSWDLLVNTQSDGLHYSAYVAKHPVLVDKSHLIPSIANSAPASPITIRPVVFCTHSSLAREAIAV